jgi:hypothetical protein
VDSWTLGDDEELSLLVHLSDLALGHLLVVERRLSALSHTVVAD